MKTIKRLSLIFFAVLILAINIHVYAFATGDVVQFTEAAKLGASIVDLYGMANNTSLAYDVASSGSALTVIENLYTEYSSSAGDPYTLAAIGAAAAVAGAVAVIYDAVTGQGYIQLYQEQYISSLDGYWDYQLTDAGLVRDSITGLFNWSLNNQDTVDPIILLASYGNFFDQPISTNINNPHYGGVTESHNDVPSNQRGKSTYFYAASNGVYLFASPYLNHVRIYYAYTSSVPNITVYQKIGTNSYQSYSSASVYNVIKYANTGMYFDQSSLGVPYFELYTDGINAVADIINGVATPDVVSIEPYWGDPLEKPLEIIIPDNTAPDYVPVPRRITTTMPIPDGIEIPLPEGVDTPEYGVPYPITDTAILNDLVPEIWDNIVADDIGLRDAPEPIEPETPSNPSEVFIPLLPVTLPSFNFSFSGIWHYVREWVASLGAWLTMLFSVWNSLPYAIIVPVYATAVIVIVLGVYRRFFM